MGDGSAHLRCEGSAADALKLPPRRTYSTPPQNRLLKPHRWSLGHVNNDFDARIVGTLRIGSLACGDARHAGTVDHAGLCTEVQ
jgi:predicted NAD/FAD-dependent oxidoreductase